MGQGAEASALAQRAVLCVGGRTASVPVYRRLIESQGARFLHHDGGDEHSAGQLESTLAAADLVICQAGCVSHNAYWRVKDHCRRTGKRCVFVENRRFDLLHRLRRRAGFGGDAAELLDDRRSRGTTHLLTVIGVGLFCHGSSEKTKGTRHPRRGMCAPDWVKKGRWRGAAASGSSGCLTTPKKTMGH